MQEVQQFFEKESLFGFNETVDILVAAAIDREWDNPATHDLQQSMAKSGRSVRPVKVIEICKPAYSGMMLEKNEERIVSVIMPCRISVYEKVDGKIYIATLNIKLVTSTMPDSVQIAMMSAAAEIEEIVRAVAR